LKIGGAKSQIFIIPLGRLTVKSLKQKIEEWETAGFVLICDFFIDYQKKSLLLYRFLSITVILWKITMN
jgi:hypothetical protein